MVGENKKNLQVVEGLWLEIWDVIVPGLLLNAIANVVGEEKFSCTVCVGGRVMARDLGCNCSWSVVSILFYYYYFGIRSCI